MALSEEQREDLKQQYGSNCVLVDKTDDGLGVFLFKKPSAVSFERYLDTLTTDRKGHKKHSAFPQLCRECLVYPVNDATGKPDQSKLSTLFEEFPGLPATIAGELSDLAGAGESHAGKL